MLADSIRKLIFRSLTVCLSLAVSVPVIASDEMLTNGGFEDGWSSWSPFWSREKNAGSAQIDKSNRHRGKQAVRVKHTGSKDWCVNRRERIPVQPLQKYELRGWARLEGEGTVSLSVTLYDKNEKAIHWTYAAQNVTEKSKWQELKTRFLIPPGATAMTPRFVGAGSAMVWFDDVSLTRQGQITPIQNSDAPKMVDVENQNLKVIFTPEDATLNVTDKRTGRMWKQEPIGPGLIPADIKVIRGITEMKLVHPESAQEFTVKIHPYIDEPEIYLEIDGQGKLPGALAFPYPFMTRPGDFLILPVNEGISYPVEDKSLSEMYYHLYGGHGLCMAWYGVTNGEQGMMIIVETPDDAAVRVIRKEGRLCQAPQWQGQKGQFGYKRNLRYIFFDKGGYVAMAKRYRQYAKQIGLFKTLAEKRKRREALDKLIGAVNVWCWQKDAPAFCREMQNLGIERILWSNRRGPEELKQLNEMGVLTSRYDIYQDVMNPANLPKLRGVHPDWPTEAWPNDLMVLQDGSYTKGWRVRGKEGKMYPCNVLCDKQAPNYARKRIAAELKTHPYKSRFIDTTTASPWRECFNPNHPMTRSESKFYKMQLLKVVSEEFNLVCGSETGHDAAVPYVDYFEGMLSLGPYRVPDAGRKMRELWHEVPERVAKFQTGHYYRLPLWELVYHDCVVAHWYWGDYNNKLPSLWDRRDLFNALYATAPMFMFDTKVWNQYKDRFAQSYKATCPIVRQCGYSEMLEHRWLSEDHAVQQTNFDNGMTITVNFGNTSYRMKDGFSLKPLSKRVVDQNKIVVVTQRRTPKANDSEVFYVTQKKQAWEPGKTAVIVCDMWDQHWCQGATSRVAEMAPRMNEFVSQARQRGVLIIHAPSGTINHYKDHPARKWTQSVPKAKNLPKNIGRWCSWMDENEKKVYPIDQSDGGCDCVPKCKQAHPWRKQIETIEIKEQDAISDSGAEVWSLLEQRGIENVMLLGVHTNMCVSGRPFGLRNLARNGKNVVLVRDLTDTMYNSQSKPYVNHFTGTDLIVEHIEKYICPTITSDVLTGRKPFQFAKDKRTRIVFLSAESEYKAAETLPIFAQTLEKKFDYHFQILQGSYSPSSGDRNTIIGMEALKNADLLIVFARRRAFPAAQMKYLHEYLDRGKPLIALRTASHAFDTKGKHPEGHVEWRDFDPTVLGGNYHGHYGHGPQCTVTPVAQARNHPILQGVKLPFLSMGSLYKNNPLKPSTTSLLMGNIPNQAPESVAWTNTYKTSRIFYSSLGYPDDFKNPEFVRLLTNAIHWAMDKPIPK